MKRLAIALIGAFIIALAIVVGKRMSPDAMAVVVGIICGVGASIPTSLLMLVLLNRRDQQQEADQKAQAPAMPAGMPSIMIVNPGGMPQQSYLSQGSMPSYYPPFINGGTRQYQVLGGDDEMERPAGRNMF